MAKTGRTLGCLLTAGIMMIFGCSKSSEDMLNTPAPGGCDTTDMSYAVDITPILQANCYSCHGNGSISGGVSLDRYAGVQTVADNGDLTGVITHAAGYPPMPQGGAKLSDCDINKIKAWINSGTPNN